jgi:hypothetical protein
MGPDGRNSGSRTDAENAGPNGCVGGKLGGLGGGVKGDWRNCGILESYGAVCHAYVMIRQNPFSGLPSRAIDELMRSQREQNQLISQALGSTLGLQRQIETLSNPLQQFAALQKAGNFGALATMTSMNQYPFENLRKFMTSEWASAIQDSALAVSRQAAL